MGLPGNLDRKLIESLISRNLRGELTIPEEKKVFEHEDNPTSVRHRLSDLLWAIQHRDLKHLQDLIEDDTINAYSAEGSTPLHLASLLGYSDVAKILLDHGAFVFAKTKIAGQTALHLAQSGNHLELVELLKSCGAHLRQTEAG